MLFKQGLKSTFHVAYALLTALRVNESRHLCSFAGHEFHYKKNIFKPSRPKYYNLNSNVVGRGIKLLCTAQAEIVVGRRKKKEQEETLKIPVVQGVYRNKWYLQFLCSNMTYL